jgi:hypothetical protein
MLQIFYGQRGFFFLLTLLLCLGVAFEHAEAAKKRGKRRKYTGPPPTHPVVLWGRTLDQSTNKEERRQAAFKLSAYSQPIYQQAVVDSLVKCMRDSDPQVKVYCAKAMARAGTASNADVVRKALLERYHNDPDLRDTIVRAFIVRRDSSPAVHDKFLEELRDSKKTGEQLVLLGYFEVFGNGSDAFVDAMARLYEKTSDTKVRTAIAKTLASRGGGQAKVVELLVQGARGNDTPLALICLEGLRTQAKGQASVWSVVEAKLGSGDTDVQLAVLDLITVLPERPSATLSKQLLNIAEDSDDPEILEKAVLALGVCGDGSRPVVNGLLKMLQNEDMEEIARIAAALTLGRQAAKAPEDARIALAECAKNGKTQSLSSACQLGLRDLEQRTKGPAAEGTAETGETATRQHASTEEASATN